MFEQWDHLWSKSSSSFDLTVKLSMRLWHYLPKDNFFCLLVIFYTKDCNSVDQSRSCRCERQLPPHCLKSMKLSHSAWGRTNHCPYECPRRANMDTQHSTPWMNTCIELTTAVYMHRVCNFAGFKPKCKTDFLPWLHYSKFFMHTM